MGWYHRMLNIFRSERLSGDIQREVEFHLAERADELRAFGFSEREAEYEARRRFGNRALLRERTRESDLAAWLDSAAGDLRYGLRALRRSPVFAIVAIGSIALGVGATTAVYTLIDAVLLRSLPVPHPEELLQVAMADAGKGGFVRRALNNQYFSNPLWEQVRDHDHGFASVMAYTNVRFNLANGGEARYVNGILASGDYFKVFGVTPAVGRLFTPRDDVRGCPGVAVLSYAYWEREFARRGDVVGRTISLDGKPVQIIGVAEDGFAGPEVGRAPQIIMPMCADMYLRGERHSLDARSTWWMRVVGRRPAGVDPRVIGARLQAIAPAAFAATVSPRAGVETRREYVTRTFAIAEAPTGLSGLRTQYSRALLTLMTFVALVMLIACVNVANLLLARAAARRREVAIRLAIGAARSRLVRQLLTESVLLAVFGAIGGLILARWGAAALVSMISTPDRTVVLDLSINRNVLAFAGTVTALTVAIFGLIPAWRGTRVTLQTAMKTASRGAVEGHARFTLGKALVSAQVALSLVLLVGAGLLVGSLRKLSTAENGFRADGILIVEADLRRTGIPREELEAVQDALLSTFRALPGVTSASSSDLTPVGGSTWNEVIAVQGYTPARMEDALAWFNRVSDGYFATMDTRLLIGRDFNSADGPSAPSVAIVNDVMARKFFGTGNPLGRQLRFKLGDTLSTPMTVIGVVENAKYQSLREEPSPIVHVAMSQTPGRPGEMVAELRTPGDPTMLVPAVKAAAARIHPGILLDFRTLSQQLGSSISRERLMARLSALFGGVALALAILGLYGVMAYSVTRRRNEIGVRLALGADRARVVRLVLGDVTRVVIVGCVVGAAAAAGSGKFVASLLYGMKPIEPLLLWFAAVVLLLVALAAGLGPALGASRVDPVSALRDE
jgi:predicted permease